MPWSRPPWASVVLAILLPLAVLAGAWGSLQRPERAEGRNLAMERSLRMADEVEVVVLGSSLARTNVDLDALADGLGVPRRNVVLMTLPNATAPHWYAVLKNKVYARGHRPKLVLLVGALTTMITPEVLMDTSVDRLVEQLTDDEPVIAAKVFGTDDPNLFRWLYLRGQAWDVRDAWIQAWRDRALGLMFRGRWTGDGGARLAERANEVVFADEKMAYELHRGGGTGLYVGAVEELTLDGLDVGRESLVPEIAALAEEHGGRAVFVRTPFPPSNQDNDLVPPDVEAEALEVIEGSGGVYLDLRSLNLDDRFFRDMRHMSQEGAALFTRAVAALLRNQGLAGRRAGSGDARKLTPTALTRDPAPEHLLRVAGAERIGGCGWRLDVPGVAAIGDAQLAAVGRPGASPLRVRSGDLLLPGTPGDAATCRPGVEVLDGTLVVVTPEGHTEVPQVSLEGSVGFEVPGDAVPAWWVYPGTTLTVSFEAGWPFPAGAFDTMLRATAFGEGAPSFVLSGTEVEVRRAGDRLSAHATPPLPPEGPWTLTLTVPAEGPFVLVQNLRLGRPPFSVHLVGLPEALAGASIRIVGGKVEDTQVAPQFEAAPPPVVPDGPLKVLPRGIGMMPVAAWRAVADAASSRDATAHKCSPLRVLADGVPLPGHHAPCADVGSLRGGRVCHAGNVLYFAAVEGNVGGGGVDYTAALDPSRLCERRNTKSTTPLRGAVWLYPGDRARFVIPPERLAAFQDGANLLEVAADPLGDDAGARLEVALHVGGEEVLREVREGEGSKRVYLQQRLDPPLAPRASDVVLELGNPSDAWWLVLLAALSEDTTGEGLAGTNERGEAGTEASAAAPLPVAGPGLDAGERLRPFTGRVAWSRVGNPPVLPAPKDLEVVRDRLVEAHLFSLWPVSTSSLVRRGYGPWSPLRLDEGGRTLRPVADRAAMRAPGCEDCFLHIGQSVVLPRGSTKGPAVSASLARDVPMAVEGGQVVWVYPGTRVVAEVTDPAAGPSTRLRARIDTFAGEKGSTGPEPVLRLGDRRARFVVAEAGRVAELDLTGRGPWPVEVEVPVGGAYTLWLGLEFVDGDEVRPVWTPPEPPAAPTEDALTP